MGFSTEARTQYPPVFNMYKQDDQHNELFSPEFLNIFNARYIKIIIIKCAKVPFTDNERMEMFYLTSHSTHFIYGYMASKEIHNNILLFNKHN